VCESCLSVCKTNPQQWLVFESKPQWACDNWDSEGHDWLECKTCMVGQAGKLSEPLELLRRIAVLYRRVSDELERRQTAWNAAFAKRKHEALAG
jgi:hypothetical protein